MWSVFYIDNTDHPSSHRNINYTFTKQQLFTSRHTISIWNPLNRSLNYDKMIRVEQKHNFTSNEYVLKYFLGGIWVKHANYKWPVHFVEVLISVLGRIKFQKKGWIKSRLPSYVIYTTVFRSPSISYAGNVLLFPTS